jgi:hypothetical protein
VLLMDMGKAANPRIDHGVRGRGCRREAPVVLAFQALHGIREGGIYIDHAVAETEALARLPQRCNRQWLPVVHLPAVHLPVPRLPQ